jgi:hypothetical protein
MTRILPEGSLIVWKKCRDNVLAKLRVEEGTTRSHAFGRKCRAERVTVLEIIGGDIGLNYHLEQNQTEYRAGEVVVCDRWEEDYTKECAGGIHFFVTREEAEAYK